MKLSYNLTGAERKTLVGAISTALNAPAKYLGAPTFAYEVGEYRIDKVGTLTGPDSLDLEDALHQAGFDADSDSREYDEPDTYESGLGGMDALDEFSDIDQHHPGRYINPDAPITDAMQKQLDEVLASAEQKSHNKGEQCADSGKETGLTISLPFDKASFENLTKLIEAKGSLIRKAIGITATPIEFYNDTVSFPWFDTMPEPDEVSAYSQFIVALCAMSKSQKRVNAVEKEVENEKYAFRCLLLRLGFIGDLYRKERKILLRNLSGSSAFKNSDGKPHKKAEINTIPGGNDNE
ncbi:MAG: virulence protein [Eubacteriales bacterium]|nr:virulence protein [Eubacteriales bacterium]MDD4475524.1 virulence protein [Eubacteriales bacterium]